ncbi:MAG: hypothetical protein LBE92_13520 [Chryseobacterium sp.]|uniref:hypothetical protein n=1 Tax=Chryseobacterium sp. TaxID=1871047 RepID=UPI0028194119|nr:hypothetical protein [Chryseobacterium sp.]MDR2237135.1 hypothetical protein [Chryseobacterium sp.]
MRKSIKINKPCPEKWEAMKEHHEGKFCEKCSKCVMDLTHKTDEQIQDMLTSNRGKELCGKIPSLSMFAAGIVLVTHLSFVQAQTKTGFTPSTEQRETATTQLSGKLIFKRTKKEIANAEVFLISKNRYYKALTDDKGNFMLEIPNESIGRKNVLYFDFEKLNKSVIENLNRKPTNPFNDDLYENTSLFFSKNEKINGQEFQIDSEHTYIGAVMISEERAPDYYYFNGKSISEKKFEKLKEENPGYQYFFFKDREAEVIAGKNYLNSLQLLYSN